MNNNNCICISLRKATNNILKLYDNKLSILDIKIIKHSTLKSIQDLGSPNVNELSQKLIRERTTILKNLTKLKNLGLMSYRKKININSKLLVLLLMVKKKLGKA